MAELKVNPDQPEEQRELQPVMNLRSDITFELPDGRHVTMGKPVHPVDLLLPDLVASYSALSNGNMEPHALSLNLLNATKMSFVRSINGKPVMQPKSATEVAMIMNDLGQDGCEAVSDFYIYDFGPVRKEQLKIIKK